MNKQKLTEIEARLMAITQGNWDSDGENVYVDDEWCTAIASNATVSDADFLAHAPSDIGNLLKEVDKLRGVLETFTDWMAYWPPRSGEVHCRWCGNRFWIGDDGKPLENIDNAHEADCSFVIARRALY